MQKQKKHSLTYIFPLKPIHPALFVRPNLRIILTAAALFISSLRVGAIINASLQMQLGNPSGAITDTNNHNHYLIQRTVEAIDFSDNLGEPNWASWDLTSSDVGSSGRSPDFFTDTNLPANFTWVAPGDYSGSGYDRGHMCPSADRTDNTTDNDMVFLMSNIIPQASQNNQGVWANFEDYCRTLASAGNELLIICGPSVFNGSRIPSGKAAIAAYTWKIVVVVPAGSGNAVSRIDTSTRVIAIKVPNNNSVSSSWQNYVTSAAQIEVDTGYTFFTALSPSIASALRNKVDGQSTPPPIILGFSPASGAAGTNVIITGTNFDSASAVTFNGLSASFTFNSTTQITATVPPNATTGPISVTTPGGTALSGSNFAVTGPAFVDLTVTSSHSGIFVQGDIGRTYTLVVTNVGSAASSGTVTVSDALPAGLTATVVSGTGWSTDLNTLTFTRSDSLPAGQAFAPITITFNIATNAPALVTNIATISGGNDTNSANNTSSDLTSINALGNGGGTNAITLVGWDTSTLPGGNGNYGPSPFAPTTNAPNLAIVGLTRGSGVGTGQSGAQRGWGGNTWNSSSSAAAIAANQYATFSVAAANGYTVSYSSISHFDYRHSTTGPINGLLQYQIGSGAFVDITTVSYTNNTTSGSSLNPIDLSGVAALQNVGTGTNVTFRIVNWGGSSSAGTWYVFDVAQSTAPDLVIQGIVAPAVVPVPDLVVSLSHGGTFTQGDAVDTYTITVTNIGTAATSGTITVADVLPAGLTATAISGPGWTPNLGALTCTRSDALAAGADYPPITVTVSVATNAPASVTNVASVSGGGESNLQNDTAADPTTVVPLTPVQAWRLQWFGTTFDIGAAADTAVASSDGMPNLLKYALGLNPLVPASDPVTGDISTGYLRLTVPRNPNAPDITLHVEVTTDLQSTWTEAGTTIDQSTPTLLQVHYNTPVNASASGYIRLRVSRP